MGASPRKRNYVALLIGLSLCLCLSVPSVFGACQREDGGSQGTNPSRQEQVYDSQRANASRQDKAEGAQEANDSRQEQTPGIPSLTFKSEAKLQDHFEKHGWETGSESAQDYLAKANAVVADPASLHKVQQDGDDAYFLERTGEFVVVSPQGYLRTYYITDRNYFDRQ